MVSQLPHAFKQTEWHGAAVALQSRDLYTLRRLPQFAWLPTALEFTMQIRTNLPVNMQPLETIVPFDWASRHPLGLARSC